MKKSKNAFTLIELLAVIVILAVIALIATPIILGIVEDAKKDAFLRSVELVISTTDIDIANKTFEEEYTYEIIDGNISNMEVSVKNTDGMNGKIIYNSEGKEVYAIHNGVYCVNKTSDMYKAEISDYKEGECVIVVPTSEKCFAYENESIIYEYEIIDVNKCVEYHGWMSEETATSLCNNEPQEDFMGLTLTEVLKLDESEWADELINIGIISKIIIDGVLITNYYDYENNDSSKLECPRDVVIPDKINGLSVITIGDHAFAEKNITSVKFPSTLINIGSSAFGFNFLSGELDLSNTRLVEIGEDAFSGSDEISANQITSIKFPNTLVFIRNGAFQYNNLSGELDLSNTKLVEIGQAAFSGSKYVKLNQITSLKLPSSVQSIMNWAFAYNSIGKIDMSYDNVLVETGAFCGHNLSENSLEYQNIYNISSLALDCEV